MFNFQVSEQIHKIYPIFLIEILFFYTFKKNIYINLSVFVPEYIPTTVRNKYSVSYI